MKIVADEDITHVQEVFGSAGDLLLRPGRSLTRQDVMHADVLLIRSVTHVNQDLLHDTHVKYVGSVVSGTDHLDIDYLNQEGIAWGTAKGCNSRAVVEYVISTIAALQKQGFLDGEDLRAGVIGVGQIGSQVVEILKLLGFDVIMHDPIRAENEKDFVSTPLDAFNDLDFITIHTPLTKHGPHPTHHMINAAFIGRQSPDCILLNTSRGGVIDSEAIKVYRRHLVWCLDVWENEPNIDLEVFRSATLGTPHIAGHSVQSKLRAVDMIHRAMIEKKIIRDVPRAHVEYPTRSLVVNEHMHDWRDIVLRVYNPYLTTQEMNAGLLKHMNTFDGMRKQFADRFEFAFTKLRDPHLCRDGDILRMLGFNTTSYYH